MWPYDIDNYNPEAWNKPNPTVEVLKKRDDHMMEQIRVLTGQVADLRKSILVTDQNLLTVVQYSHVYQFYFEDKIDKQEARRLITMLNSPDEQDRNLAREIILKKIK